MCSQTWNRERTVQCKIPEKSTNVKDILDVKTFFNVSIREPAIFIINGVTLMV
jgi:hypothetical protein